MGQTAPNDPETPWEVDCVVIELRVKRTTAAPAAGDGSMAQTKAESATWT